MRGEPPAAVAEERMPEFDLEIAGFAGGGAVVIDSRRGSELDRVSGAVVVETDPATTMAGTTAADFGFTVDEEEASDAIVGVTALVDDATGAFDGDGFGFDAASLLTGVVEVVDFAARSS